MPASPHSSATIFSVQPGTTSNSADVKQLGTANLAGKYSLVEALMVGENSYLIAYNPPVAAADAYQVWTTAQFLSLSKAKLRIGKAKDTLNFFALGNLSYLMSIPRRMKSSLSIELNQPTPES